MHCYMYFLIRPTMSLFCLKSRVKSFRPKWPCWPDIRSGLMFWSAIARGTRRNPNTVLPQLMLPMMFACTCQLSAWTSMTCAVQRASVLSCPYFVLNQELLPSTRRVLTWQLLWVLVLFWNCQRSQKEPNTLRRNYVCSVAGCCLQPN